MQWSYIGPCTYIHNMLTDLQMYNGDGSKVLHTKSTVHGPKDACKFAMLAVHGSSGSYEQYG